MIWYPYEQMKTMKEPYHIVDADGVYLYTKDQKLIDSFESMRGQENRARLSLLISYRLLLLDIIHAEQKKLDCLDYLIRQTAKVIH